MVDPKPYTGDPAFNVTQHLLNHLKRVELNPMDITRTNASLAGVEVERALCGCFAVFPVSGGDAFSLWLENLREKYFNSTTS